MSRIAYTFEVPATVEAPFRAVTLRMNTVQEEADAYARANNAPVKAVQEQVKAALVSVMGTDGVLKKLSLADGSADTFFNSLEGPARELVALAWQEINAAKEEDKKAFLLTKKASV